MEEEMHTLRYKGENENRRHEDGWSIYLRVDVFINGFEGVED